MGLCGNGSVFGPFFFERSVNGASYLKMLNEDGFPQILRAFPRLFVNGKFQRLWSAQDGAPPHRMGEVREWLSEFFPNHTVALHHPTELPPRSPDLTPLDFFLWGYLKNQVYTSVAPANLDQLIQRVSEKVDELNRNPGLVRKAVRDIIRRATVCLENEGGHVEGNQ